MAGVVTQNREQWQSKSGFVLASAGSAIGFGNFWRFAYLVGMNGGAAFVLVYLASVIVIGIPIMVAEFLIGQKTKLSIAGAFRKLTNRSGVWSSIGLIGVVASFITLSYYAVIGGWVTHYLAQALIGNLPVDSSTAVTAFSQLSGSPWPQIIWYTLFSLLAANIVARGIRAGIERYSRSLMLLFLILLIGLFVYSLNLPGAIESLKFMFTFDLSKFNSTAAMLAVGHTFFSLSLGQGIMVAYGSYLPKKITIPFASAITTIIDTSTALLAGITIFAIVFSFGLAPDSGTGLAFITLPPILSTMPAGQVLGILFFFLLMIAGLTSAVSMLEVVTVYLIDEWKVNRTLATWGSAIAIYLFGLVWLVNDITVVDRIAGGYLLILGGLAIALLVGWMIPAKILAQTLQVKTTNGWLSIFRWLNRYLIPTVLIYLLISGAL
ncbi:MAG: sodium-dependent transporter [Patescibacteria group bacterium]|jgi:NSS family neurotransmitter:Na+ symporter